MKIIFYIGFVAILVAGAFGVRFEGVVTVENGETEFKLKYLTRSGIRYTSSDEINTIADNRFYSAIKRKESLAIDGDSFVFSPANRFVVVAERTYDLGAPTIVESDALLIPLFPFLDILADRKGMHTETDGNNVVFTPGVSLEQPVYAISDEPVDTTGVPGVEPDTSTVGPILKDEPRKTRWLIMVDPGHGGKDPGASAKDKTREKDVVLDISKKLCAILEVDTLFEVKITRDKDVFIPLRERTEMANSEGADLFLSVHCNAARNKSARGTQVFFLAPARSDHARATAALENASIFLEESSESDTLSDLDFIMADVIQNEFLRESSRLAVLIEEAIAKETGLPARGPAGAGFYVLNGSFMPAVLIESAFLSNSDDAALLKTESFREKVARGIAEGLRNFILELPE
ncbi:hypothetical protein DRQ36_02860 [bacterium]|nr:MAG: hypothetical protein DRQ36_02860 [bacterium]